MRLKAWLLLFFACLLVLGMPSAASANDSSLGGTGGSVYPVDNGEVRMESEAIQAIVYGGFAEYRVDFHFVNTGSEHKVKLGFPFARTAEGDQRPEAAFRAWQDGASLEVTTAERRLPGGDRLLYYVHEAVMKPGETDIRVSYLAAPDSSVPVPPALTPPPEFAGMLGAPQSYDYWLHTGSGWKGTIGRSVVRFAFAEDFLGWGLGDRAAPNADGAPYTTPPGFTRPDDHSIQWEFDDFEPVADSSGLSKAYDVHLGFYQPSWIDAPSGAPPRPIPNVSTSRDSAPSFAVDGSPLTAWAVGSDRRGTSANLLFDFGRIRPIREIRVVPGNVLSDALFHQFDRPKTLLARFSDGTTQTLSLADEPSVQRFATNKDVKWVELTVGDIYLGSAGKATYITEVEFDTAPAPGFKTFDELMASVPASAGPSVGQRIGSALATAREKPPVLLGVQLSLWAWTLIALCGLLVLGLVLGLVVMIVRQARTSPSAVEADKGVEGAKDEAAPVEEKVKEPATAAKAGETKEAEKTADAAEAPPGNAPTGKVASAKKKPKADEPDSQD